MAQTIIRTISQLRQLSAGNALSSPDSLMEISFYDNNQDMFSSRAYPYKALSADMNDMISASMTKQYNLSASRNLNSSYFQADPKLTICNTVKYLAGLYNDNLSVDGQKTFSKIPFVIATPEQYDKAENFQVVNVCKAQDMINNTGAFITPESYTPYPFNDDEMPKSPGVEDPEPSNFIHIKYENSSSFVTTAFTADKTGWLTMWGWVASLGDVDPEKAWIALYGNVVVDKLTQTIPTTADVPLQFQPWIVGANSKQLQYVGFSLPVKKGMTFYVKSGFNVNIDAAAGYQNVRSKTYNTNQAGSFFGYILENS